VERDHRGEDVGSTRFKHDVGKTRLVEADEMGEQLGDAVRTSPSGRGWTLA